MGMTADANTKLALLARFCGWYRRRRVLIWFLVFVLPVILSIATFLWHIEARNLKLSCYPERTYWACFSGKHIHYTLLGFFVYPIKFYSWFFIRLFIPVFLMEALYKFYSRR